MASISSSPKADKDRIERWREETSLTLERNFGIIARLCSTCLELLQILLQHSSPTWITTPGNRKLRQSYSLLQLWDHGHKVVEGRLDHHLEHSTEIRQATIEVLRLFCECLLDGVSTFTLPQVKEESVKLQYASALELYSQSRWHLETADESSSEDDDDSDSDNDKDDSFRSRADTMTRRIKTYTDCLMGFGAAFDCPASDDAHDEQPGVAGGMPPSAHDYHTELIRMKYDKAEIRLLKVLGQVSWSRFLRMQCERNNDTVAVEEPQQRTVPHIAKSAGPVSEFEDSGIGTSLVKTQSSYAESIVSFMTSISGGERVRIPPLPLEGKNGFPFECTACGKLVRAKNNREWRKHLYTDLQPYSCFYYECQFSTNPFPSRQVWINHLELEHNFGPAWEAVECPLCLDTSGNGKSTILNHFSRHMEDIALVALPPGVDPDAESDTSEQLPDDTMEVRSTNLEESPEATYTNLVHGTDMGHFESYSISVVRPIQASCDVCVASKIRCSRGRPKCAHCSANELHCVYNDQSYRSLALLQLKSSSKGMYFVLLKHDDSNMEILEQYVCKEVGFRRSFDECITWIRENGEKVELIFQTTKDCDSVWNRLKGANDRPVQGNNQDSLLEARHFSLSPSPEPATLGTQANVIIDDWTQQPGLSPGLVYSGEEDARHSHDSDSDSDTANLGLESETVQSVLSTVPGLIHQSNNLAHSSPSLHSSSPEAAPSETSISTDLAGHLAGFPLLDEGLDGILEIPQGQTAPTYECTFWFLDCGYVSINREEWERHCLSHFRGEEPPPKVQCPLCEWTAHVQENSGGGHVVWAMGMQHIASNHVMFGQTLRTSRPDFELFDYLWEKRLISTEDLKELKSSNHDLSYPPSNYSEVSGR